MSRAKEMLENLLKLDSYILRLVERRDRLNASRLSSPQLSDMKVLGGKRKQQDDIYVEYLTTKQEIEVKAAEAMRKQRELQNMIDRLSFDSGEILSMVYIDKMTVWQVCDRYSCSTRTYYRKINQAYDELDDLICHDLA
ncbi:Protein of unknown function [Streptococcus henryi]|uniref:DUF1492 domain-containing protein n=1 Tax=Streptococcus henryi TaxID=439219 RepID=A0A1G6AK28_9STRE|nr:DUF1492 domain-containing protein [Streptococcus henryi]QBX25329.1 hypothetical protein Javan252_0028 [Streptococcus phage Javan252]SDB08777.1 Protein of unknown function [Streptococcus henryi]